MTQEKRAPEGCDTDQDACQRNGSRWRRRIAGMIIDKGKKVKTREKSTLKARASLPIKEATWRERKSSIHAPLELVP